MKKIALVCLLSAQLICSCAQEPSGVATYTTRLEALSASMDKLEAEYMDIRKQAGNTPNAAQTARMEAISDEADSVGQQQLALTLEFAEKYKDSKEPATYIAQVMYDLSYEQLEKLCDPSTGYYNETAMEKPKKMLASMKLRQPGTPYKELTMQDLDGKQMKLSQWIGKGYVLVDFWASWCGPCRAEMPNVVESYKKYHDKGYEIVGVSFDQKQAAWAAAVKKLGMTWPQMSDLKGWDCAAHDVYGVNSIPCNVLIGPDGKIVACDLRGEALQEKLAEIYK